MTDELVAAVDVGGTSMKGTLMSRSGPVRPVESRSTRGLDVQDSLVQAVLEFADDLVVAGCEGWGRDAVRGVGLSVAGLVDEERGVAVSSMILGWREVPFTRLVGRRTGLPVGFGHDVRAAGRAEGVLGAARGHSEYLFVSLGTGVGSSMVLGGEAYVGANAVGGELAHFAVEPEGPPCRCGKFGCLEMVASAEAVARRYGELGGFAAEISARDVVERVRRDDPAARGVWTRAVVALGKAIATYIEFLDPSLVVVGGGMADAGATLFDPLGEYVRRNVSRPETAAPVVPGDLGAMAGIHGAALLAWERVDGSLERVGPGPRPVGAAASRAYDGEEP